MANQLREAKVLSIKMLYEQGWSQRRIARELGINRESVARYLKQDSKPAKAPRVARFKTSHCRKSVHRVGG